MSHRDIPYIYLRFVVSKNPTDSDFLHYSDICMLGRPAS